VGRAIKLIAVILALGGALVGFFLLIRTQAVTTPFCLSLPIREYGSTAYPVNPLAEQDTVAITDCFPAKLKKPAFNSQTQKLIVEELQQLRSHADRPLIVHLSCLATVHEGEVYLLPGDAVPGEPLTWLPLRRVTELIAECPAAGKILLLDIAHPVTDRRFGVVSGPQQLDAALAKQNLAKSDKFWILISCTGGQASHGSEELGTSVFAHYVRQALRATADQRLTVKQVAEFVRSRTERWALDNRGQHQTPTLWGADTDFVLASVTDGVTAPPAANALAYPKWLQEGWELRDRLLQKDKVHRRAPQALHQLEEQLLRIEERWRSGFESARLEKETDALKADYSTPVKSSILEIPQHSLTLAMMRQTAGSGLEPSVQDLIELLEKAKEVDKAKDAAAAKDEMAKLIEKEWMPLVKKEDEKKRKSNPVMLAALLMEALVEVPRPEPVQLAFAKEALRRLQTERYIETLWLDRVAGLPGLIGKDKTAWKLTAVAIGQGFQALQAREALIALASQEPAMVGLIDASFRQADKDRQEGEKLLLWETGQAREATALLQRAGETYRKLQDAIVHWRDTRHSIEDVGARLYGYLLYLSVAPDPEQGEKLWTQIRDETQRLMDLLTAEQLGEGDLPDSSVLRFRLDSMQKLLESRARSLTKLGADGDVFDLDKIEALLACPCLDAKSRTDVWTAGHKLRKRLLDQTLQQDEKDGYSPLPGAGTTARATDMKAVQTSQALRQAGLTLDLLKLAGVQGLEPLSRALDRAKANPSTEELESLGQLVRKAWMRQFPEQLRAAKEDLTRLDRLTRIAPLPGAIGRAEDSGITSALTARRSEQHRAFKLWLADRFSDEAQFLGQPGSEEQQSTREYFINAAAELRR
jgi:hypothetical protein